MITPAPIENCPVCGHDTHVHYCSSIFDMATLKTETILFFCKECKVPFAFELNTDLNEYELVTAYEAKK